MIVPVPFGVVQRAARPHRLKVVDAPSHEGNSSPEDGKDPDDGAHRQSSAPEELLSFRSEDKYWIENSPFNILFVLNTGHAR